MKWINRRSDLRLLGNTVAAISDLFSICLIDHHEKSLNTMLFFWCVLIKSKKTNTTLHLCPFSLKKFRVFGILHLSTPYWYQFIKWEINKSTQMTLLSEVDLDMHPWYSFVLGFYNPCAKIPSFRNMTAPGSRRCWNRNFN